MGSLRSRYRYQDTLTKVSPPVRERSEQLREQFASSAEPTPLPPRRPMSEVEAYLIHMQQKDLRKRNPQIPSKLFTLIRKKAYGKTEGKLHRLTRQGKISSVYVPLAKRKKKAAKKAARKKLRPRN